MLLKAHCERFVRLQLEMGFNQDSSVVFAFIQSRVSAMLSPAHTVTRYLGGKCTQIQYLATTKLVSSTAGSWVIC